MSLRERFKDRRSVKGDEEANTVTVTQGKSQATYTREAWTELEAREDFDDAVNRALEGE